MKVVKQGLKPPIPIQSRQNRIWFQLHCRCIACCAVLRCGVAYCYAYFQRTKKMLVLLCAVTFKRCTYTHITCTHITHTGRHVSLEGLHAWSVARRCPTGGRAQPISLCWCCRGSHSEFLCEHAVICVCRVCACVDDTYKQVCECVCMCVCRARACVIITYKQVCVGCALVWMITYEQVSMQSVCLCYKYIWTRGAHKDRA